MQVNSWHHKLFHFRPWRRRVTYFVLCWCFKVNFYLPYRDNFYLPYSRRNNVELSGISNEISDENLEKKVIDIWKESCINLNPYDIEVCHRIPSRCVNTSNSKRMIVKLVNRKHSEAMLCLRRSINSRSSVYIMISLCPYIGFLRGKCKDQKRKDLRNQIFFVLVQLSL